MSTAIQNPQVGDVVVIMEPAPFVEEITEGLVGALGIVKHVEHDDLGTTFVRVNDGVVWGPPYLYWYPSQLAVVGDVR